MDGVAAGTIYLHAETWKRTLDGFLKEGAEKSGIEFEPFDSEGDCLRHVDGRPRCSGSAAFPESRGIRIPGGWNILHIHCWKAFES